MNTSATIMLIISTVLLWGGLIWATVHLIKHPDEDESTLKKGTEKVPFLRLNLILTLLHI